ncbi:MULTISPECIES: hypothetical protein [unclassified Domibacillus]|uniref:hypothetical protein n=1 Tax=unclassified Domibacillus TaxID=2632383 RepID=UPI001F55C06E|nr:MULTISPECIES: hypothetical protein [unclassified Domibacillus]MCI2255500.1 hypothetical protein [Domibacillus sp. PGB-M46]
MGTAVMPVVVLTCFNYTLIGGELQAKNEHLFDFFTLPKIGICLWNEEIELSKKL